MVATGLLGNETAFAESREEFESGISTSVVQCGSQPYRYRKCTTRSIRIGACLIISSKTTRFRDA